MSYELLELPNEVTLASDVRLPFEPKGELRAMRDDLRAALLRLRGEGLWARFSGPAYGGYDLENVLFYNVGCSAFRNLAGTSLYFEKDPSQSNVDQRWRHRYATGTGMAGGWRSAGAEVAIELASEANRIGSAAEIWALTHQALGDGARSLAGRDLYLTLDLQSGTSVNLTEVAKRLIDGLFCALHQHNGEPSPDLIDRIKRVAAIGEAEARRWLQRAGPLGPSRFVWPFGQNLQWSPADDRLVAVKFNHHAREGRGWRLRAVLSDAERLPDPTA